MIPSENLPQSSYQTTRRTFLKIASASIILPACERIDKMVSGAISLIENTGKPESHEVTNISIAEQRRRISEMNKERQTTYPGRENLVQWNLQTILSNLTEGLLPVEARQILFEFVRDFPYKLLRWTPRRGIELYDEESGDCRHKREALYYLYEIRGSKVRKVAVVFDWADLPIPKEILNKLKKSGTKSLHSGLEIEIDGKFVYVDATWDKDLSKLGFPVTQNWDGINPTRDVSNAECIKVSHGEYTNQQALAAQHGIRFIESETEAFNQALNAYLEKFRNKKKPQ